MTKVAVELKKKELKCPVEIRRGQYVEINGAIYVCASVDTKSMNLVCINDGMRRGDSQEGITYTYDEQYPIRFIDSIKITEE